MQFRSLLSLFLLARRNIPSTNIRCLPAQSCVYIYITECGWLECLSKRSREIEMIKSPLCIELIEKNREWREWTNEIERTNLPPFELWWRATTVFHNSLNKFGLMLNTQANVMCNIRIVYELSWSRTKKKNTE